MGVVAVKGGGNGESAETGRVWDGPLRPAIKIIACLILFQTDLGIFIPLSYNANALWKIITKS